MDIVFWQNMPSLHQSGAIRRLTDIWGGQVYGVYDREMLPERKALGWEVPEMGGIQMHYLDSVESAELFVKNFCEVHREAIHVFGGFRGCQSVSLAWRNLKKKSNSKLVSIAERPHFRGLKAPLQIVWYWFFFKRHGCRFRAVLAMGSLGVDCFDKLGLPRHLLFPFLYQTDIGIPPSLSYHNCESKSVRFVYLGRFCSVKGVDILLASIPRLKGSFTLDFIGASGPLDESVRRLEWAGGENRVRFLGSIPASSVIAKLSGYDVCLVPSRYDGWGMVTNEALQAGIGVLVSDTAGSKDLVVASGAGCVVKSANLDAWVNAMQDVVNRPEVIASWRTRAHEYQDNLSAGMVGDYFSDVLKYSFMGEEHRPVPSWID